MKTIHDIRFTFHDTAPLVLRGFIYCLEWAEAPEGARPRMPRVTANAAASIVEDFTTQHRALYAAAIDRLGYDADRFGHDLWLTLAGHGAGFWDRPELEEGGLGEALTAAVDAFGRREAYAAGGWFYISGMERAA